MSRRTHPAGAPEIRSASDAELILRSRAGDRAAFAELYERHVAAARAAARSYARSRSDVDDLVSDGFAKVLNALSNDGGPEVAFRPYLLTCVRNAAFDRSRRDRKVRFTDEVPESAPAGLPGDPAVEDLERRLTARAFAGLPERWRMVLWHTEVEGMTPAEIAPLLGIAPNAVAALSYRAREGLREAYLQAHVREEPDGECRWVAGRLGAFVRDRLPRRDRPRVEVHLDACVRCRAALDELTAVNGSLRAVLGPLVLGSASARYLTGLGAGAAKAGGGAAGANAGIGGGAQAGLSSMGWVQAAIAAPLKAALVGAAAAATAAGVTVTTVALATGGGGRPAAPTAAGSGRPPAVAEAPATRDRPDGGVGGIGVTTTTTLPATTTTVPDDASPGAGDATPVPEDQVAETVVEPDPTGPTATTTAAPATTTTTTVPPTTTSTSTTTTSTTTPTTTTSTTTTSTTTTSTTTTSTTTSTSTSTTTTTVPPVPPVSWGIVEGAAGISVADGGHTVAFSGSGERRLLAEGTVPEPFRVGLTGSLDRPRGYPNRLPGPSLGYGVFLRATVDGRGVLSGYTFQVDPGVGGFKLACWDVNGGEHTLTTSAAPASELFGPHAVEIESGADGRVTFRSDGRDVFGGPVDLAQLAADRGCPVTPGDRVGLRAWSSSAATIDGFTVSYPPAGTPPVEASGPGAWSPVLLGLGPLAGLAVRRRSRGTRRTRRSRRS